MDIGKDLNMHLLNNNKMKLISIIILIGLFTSCYDGELNGKRYNLKRTCIESHSEHGMRLVLIGKMWTSLPYSMEVCDKYRMDTIWEASKTRTK